MREDHANPDSRHRSKWGSCDDESKYRLVHTGEREGIPVPVRHMLYRLIDKITALIMWKYLGPDEWCYNVIFIPYTSVLENVLADLSTVVNKIIVFQI